jgi:hypothetical protein
MQSPEDCVKQRTARIGILGGVPAFLLTLALGLLAFAPAASAAPTTCATDGVSPIAGTEGGLGQEFTVGAAGGDLHAYAVAALSNDGASQLSILPLDATGTPDLSAPLRSTTVNLPAPPGGLTTVALDPPERLAAGRYVVFLTPETAASWLLCAPPADGGLWLHLGLEPAVGWFRSATETLALGLDLQPEDLTAPVVSVTPPVSPTRTPHVEFTSDDATATYTCSVDGGAAKACTSPFDPAGLGDGPHTVAIVARDVMGNASAPAGAAFTVDTSAPTAAITIVPGNAANHTTAITIALSEPGTFTCVLDGAPVACAASFTVDPAAEGQHVLTVTASDQAGNSGETPATFLADWTAPDLTGLDDLEVVADASDSASRDRAGAVVDFAPVVTDNFDSEPLVECTPASGTFFALGTTAVSCLARDASGNASAAVAFNVTVVQPPPSTADVDLAFDPGHGRIAVTESHGGTIDWTGRRTLTAAVDHHETRVNLRRTDDVADVHHLEDGLKLVYLRYDGGRRLRPTSNGYAFSSSERRNGSIKRLVIAVRAGRNAVIVKYSAATDESIVRYRDLRTDRTLRVDRVDGLVIPHLRSDAGRMLIDVGSGS